jgi:hypothetical protein
MNLLALEPLLVARLKAELPSTIKVLTLPDIKAATDGTRPVPAVDVIYGGYTVEEDKGGMIKLTLKWLTMVAVRNLKEVREGAGARDEAGPLTDTVFEALHRWKPPLEGYGTLRLANPIPPIYVLGTLHFPLVWTVTLTEMTPCA